MDKMEDIKEIVKQAEEERQKTASMFEAVKERQEHAGTIANSWLLSLILSDPGQYLTESDKLALTRLSKRIEREHAKSGL